MTLCILAVSCGIKEQEEAIPSFGGYEEFYATIEQPAETDTKTFTDNDLHVLWHEDDRVTIFNKFSYNQEFAFTGETGDNSGGFSKVAGDEFVTGFDLANVYSVYPFQKSTKIDSDGKMTITLPAEQAWAERSFSRGANTMIAATADNKLKFKNIGGLLVLKLYGAGVQVSSVSLKGNAGELIAGKASVTMPIDGLPEVEMQEGAADAISLLCETPVALGSSESNYTEFWFVIPPTDFTRGFTITVTGAGGGTFEKSTDKSISISRNHISRMAPIEVSLEKPAAEPEWVDLGLSVKWATFNVGASKPEEYGDYFAWGETEPKSDYSWATYKWCNGVNDSLTKYNIYIFCLFGFYGPFEDYKTQLDPEDDAARVNWGSSCHMPTAKEWRELEDNCTWTWTDNYNGTGVAGSIVTSNMAGYTDKSIFLPAAGYLNGSDLCDAYSGGIYWSSTIDYNGPIVAWSINFYSVYRTCLSYRCCGLSVRPVYGELVQIESISLNKVSLDLYPNDSYQLTSVVSPANATAKDVFWVSSDSSVATVDAWEGLVTAKAVGSATITAYGSNGMSASCTVTVKEKTNIPDYEYVDLGLSVKWATFNVGATKPEEYGDYFAWGETEPKEGYNWYSYKLCKHNRSLLTKYNTEASFGLSLSFDNKIVLDPEDDAAYVNWGDSWRMPTDAEWTELRENCTWTWTDNYNGTGVPGRIATSNKAGYTNKSIFLPASGNRYDKDLGGAGSDGRYWSSSLYTSFPSYAYYVEFDSGSVRRKYGDRFYGRSVRPVYGESEPTEQTFSIDSWELNPDSIIGTMDKLNMTRPSDDAYYGDEPYKTYGAIGLYSPKEKDRTAIVGHFKEYSNCWKVVDDNSTFSFKVCNFKKDVVDIVAGGTNTSTGNDNGYAIANISGSDLKKINSGLAFSPDILFKNPEAMTSDVDVLVEVTEKLNGSDAIHKGYYYLTTGATCFNQIEFKGQGAELGAFADCNDYILIHELVPDIYKDGKKIIEWDEDNGRWSITNDGSNLGLHNTNLVSFSFNRLIYDNGGKDTENSFKGCLCLFEAGDILSPSPGIVQEGGIDFLVDDGRALMHDKIASYELEVYYDYEPLVKIVGDIKVLASGKKAHPYHKPDGSFWD